MKLIWLILSSCIAAAVSKERPTLFRGDYCELPDGSSGKCELIYDCINGMKELKSGRKPFVCGFDDITPIVCCSDPFIRKNLAMSKCLEYGSNKYSLDLRFKEKLNGDLGKTHKNDVNGTVEIDGTIENETDTTGWDQIDDTIKNDTGESIGGKQTERDVSLEDYKTLKLVKIQRKREIDDIPYFLKEFNTQVAAAIGGQRSIEKEFPHMAALGYGNKTHKKWLCGGSLISEEYILTAAHCLQSPEYGEVKYVRLGDVNLYSTIGVAKTQEFLISKKIRHPAYKPPEKYHDIALLKLDRLVEFNDYIQPACLHSEPRINETDLKATGWGLTEPYGNPSDHLIKVDLELFTDEECKGLYKPARGLKRGVNPEGMICAGSRTEEKGTCTGDSGGPLQSNRPNVGDLYTVYGITSFGKGCAIINAGGVYTRVSRYIPWIESIVWG